MLLWMMVKTTWLRSHGPPIWIVTNLDSEAHLEPKIRTSGLRSWQRLC